MDLRLSARAAAVAAALGFAGLGARPVAASLSITPNASIAPNTWAWDLEPGQSIPTGTAGYGNDSLYAVQAGIYRFSDPGPVAYIGLSDGDPFPIGDHEMQNLTVSVAYLGVPEPASLALFGLGLAGLGLARSRRKA